MSALIIVRAFILIGNTVQSVFTPQSTSGFSYLGEKNGDTWVPVRKEKHKKNTNKTYYGTLWKMTDQ